MPVGYSGTPLVQKLGIKPGHRLLIVGPPKDFAATLGALPDDTDLVKPTAKQINVILLFVPSLANLKKQFTAQSKRLVADGALWVCWPKKASGMPTDLTENVVRDHGLAVGLVDVKVCAVDEIWSGLKFVIRLADRKKAN
jgi:hypothetical protein